jgi:hypothetical protein
MEREFMSKTRLSRRDFLQSTSLLAGATLMGSATLITPSAAHAQASASGLENILKLRLQGEDVVDAQVQEYLMKRVLPLPDPKKAGSWTAQENQLRKQLLEKVIFHGWPKEWVDAPSKFEDLGLIPSGKGYKLRKLRYEIVPGVFTTALLRESVRQRLI